MFTLENDNILDTVEPQRNEPLLWSDQSTEQGVISSRCSNVFKIFTIKCLYYPCYYSSHKKQY